MKRKIKIDLLEFNKTTKIVSITNLGQHKPFAISVKDAKDLLFHLNTLFQDTGPAYGPQ